jgi:hypothetical protein
MNDISFEEVRKKLDDAPEGYVPRECYETVLKRANKLDDICRSIRKENKELRSMIIKVVDAIWAFNDVIDGASKKGLVDNDKD